MKATIPTSQRVMGERSIIIPQECRKRFGLRSLVFELCALYLASRSVAEDLKLKEQSTKHKTESSNYKVQKPIHRTLILFQPEFGQNRMNGFDDIRMSQLARSANTHV
jgi:hypothetical protein